MTLDPLTLQTMIIVTSLTAVIALAIVATGRRVPGLWSLSGAVLSLALTFIIYLIYPHLPLTLAIAASDCTIALTLSLLLLAILRLRGQRIHPLWVAMPPLIMVAADLLLLDAHAARSATTDAISTMQGLVTLRVLIRDGGIGIGRGRHILLASVVVSVLLFGARSLAIGSGLVAAAPPMPSVAPFDTFSYLIAYLIMVFAMLGFVLAAAEITAEQHHQLAMHDPLTGLPNRRAVLDGLARHWSTAIRTQQPLTALMIDVDHFKLINDQHGHAAGDAVLRRLAKLLRMRVRSQDMVGRYGGEEFLVVLPDTAPDGAHALAEDLRSKIASVPIRAKGNMLPVTVSVGLHGIWPTATDTVTDLIQKADEALYRAKSAGRNRVMDSQLAAAGPAAAIRSP